ncbi:MAG: iron-sulfur protein, partial [Candidatus Binatia bacterium]
MKTVQQLTKRVEEMEALDQFANFVQKVVSRIVPQESALKDLLSGTWLGRPLHPVLTDVVIGVWTSASLL